MMLELPTIYFKVLDKLDKNGDPVVEEETDYTTYYFSENTNIVITPTEGQDYTTMRVNNSENYHTINLTYLQLKKILDKEYKK